VSYVMRSSRRS